MIDKIYLHLQLNYEDSEEAEEAKKEIKELLKENADLLARLDVSSKDVMIKRKHYMVMVAIPYTNVTEKMATLLEASKKKQKAALGIYENFLNEFVDSVTPPDGMELSFWWKVQQDDE